MKKLRTYELENKPRSFAQGAAWEPIFQDHCCFQGKKVLKKGPLEQVSEKACSIILWTYGYAADVLSDTIL